MLLIQILSCWLMAEKDCVITGKKPKSPKTLLSKVSSSSTTNHKRTAIDRPISQTTGCSSVSSSVPKTPVWSCRSQPTSSKANSVSLTQRNLHKKRWFTCGSPASIPNPTIISAGGTKLYITCQNSKPRSTGNPSTCFMDIPVMKSVMFTHVFAVGSSVLPNSVILPLTKDGKTADALIK